jgi:hypothetical protein
MQETWYKISAIEINWKYDVRFQVLTAASMEITVFWDILSTDVSEVRAASIIRAIMEAALTSKTSVDIDLTTRQYILED